MSVWDPTDAGTQPRGKQVASPRGIWYTSVTGIWQTVWIEPVPDVCDRRAEIVPDIDARTLEVTCGRRHATTRARRCPSSRSTASREVARARGVTGAAAPLPCRTPGCWSPDSPIALRPQGHAHAPRPALDEVTLLLRDAQDRRSARTPTASRVCASTTGRCFRSARSTRAGGPTASTRRPPTRRCDTTSRSRRSSASTWPASTSRSSRTAGTTGRPARPARLAGHAQHGRCAAHATRRDPTQQFETRAQGDDRRAGAIIPSIVMWVPFNEGWGQYDTPRIVRVDQDVRPEPAGGQRQRLDRRRGRRRQRHARYPGPGRAEDGADARRGARRIRRPGPAARRPHLAEPGELGLPRVHVASRARPTRTSICSRACIRCSDRRGFPPRSTRRRPTSRSRSTA